MKYTVFSDLHNDHDGLEKLLAHPAIQDTTKICLGDTIMAHEPDVDFFGRVHDFADTLLLGNHEAVLVGKCELSAFGNATIHQAIVNSRAQIEQETPEILGSLSGLQAQLITDKAAFTHGSFNPDNPWRHIRYIEDLKPEEPFLPRKLNFVGHGHIPFIAWLEDGLWFYERQIYNKTFELKPELTYIINTGSLLGSREMRWFEKTFLVFDDTSLTINFYKV